MAQTPTEKPPRTPFDVWLLTRRITNAEAGERLSCAAETVRRMRLPIGDPARAIPREEVMERIFEWTAGAIIPGDFYEPRLSVRQAGMVTEAA